MLNEEHDQGQNKFVYTCNSCNSHVESGYQCTVCDNFGLCIPCYDKEGHPHEMEELESRLRDLDVSSPTRGIVEDDPPEVHRRATQRCIQSLVHACRCKSASCERPSCQKMKRVVMHTYICRRTKKSDCPICKQLIALCCYHAKECTEIKCNVPHCHRLKQKMVKLQQNVKHLGGDKQRVEQQSLKQRSLKQQWIELQRVKQQCVVQQRVEQQDLDQQDVEQQGVEQQGVEQQGVEQQGVEQQGVEQQGVEQQGMEQQGVEEQGVEEQGVEEQGVEQQGMEQQGVEEQDVDYQ